MTVFGGIPINFTVEAVERRPYCPWPPVRPSRHRSRRITKKIAKRTQAEIVEPCVFMIGRKMIIAHPTFRGQFERQTRLVATPAVLGLRFSRFIDLVSS